MNFGLPLKNLRDEVIKDVTDNKETVVTLKTICVEALLSVYPKEEVSGTDKMKRFKLAYKIENLNGDGELQLSVEELKLLKDLIGIRFSPLVVGSAYSILDPTELK